MCRAIDISANGWKDTQGFKYMWLSVPEDVYQSLINQVHDLYVPDTVTTFRLSDGALVRIPVLLVFKTKAWLFTDKIRATLNFHIRAYISMANISSHQ